MKTLPQHEIDSIKNDIRAAASVSHVQYPQYKGHWDGAEWTLVEITKDVKTKMGQAFRKGELALARRDYRDGVPRWCIYSMTNGCDTVVALNKAVEVRAS